MNPQTKQVLDLIKRDGSITRLVAMNYGIANLTARLADLRSLGHNVVCVQKRDAKNRRYGTWSIQPRVPGALLYVGDPLTCLAA